MTDHKAEANRKVVIAAGGQPAPQHGALTSEAMVHATLYLAEQQRTANLLALLGTDLPSPKIRSAIAAELVKEMQL